MWATVVNRDRSVTRLVEYCEQPGISRLDSLLVGGRETVVNLWLRRMELEAISNLKSGENN